MPNRTVIIPRDEPSEGQMNTLLQALKQSSKKIYWNNLSQHVKRYNLQSRNGSPGETVPREVVIPCGRKRFGKV